MTSYTILGLVIILLLLVLAFCGIGPKKESRQSCWYCSKGHEHWTWLGAWLCELI
jgi:hypothetical protein